ncbi:MAG: recombinase family protein [Planctomycetota bacterium]
MGSSTPNRKRCAIYTRKSSEEGLDQDFNSLDAQREACSAYVQSQKSEGWRPVRTHYDDGGSSGGNLDRPAVTQLLADIEAGKIDTVVVYKVDRLTRSLADFAKIVDVLDSNGASFVSVTQQFNTTTSMGRLTLNMLLSFAQFEREVTGERIRDKIAASKRKGLWMGGRVPLGYRANGRTLEISESEADIVRRIYDLYAREESVTRVTEEVDRLRFKTKVYVDKRGNRSGGKAFSRGHIHRILANPIYAGQISHKGAVYEGQHPGIIDAAVWDRTQEILNAKAPSRRRRGSPSLLRGRLFDEFGAPLTPSHTTKSGRRYRYYVSSSPSGAEDSPSCAPVARLPAGDIERLVSKSISELISDGERFGRLLREQGLSSAAISAVIGELSSWRGRLSDLVKRVDLTRECISIELDVSVAVRQKIAPIRHDVATRIRTRRGERRILSEVDVRSESRCLDLALLKSIARAWSWFEAISTGRIQSFAEIAAAEGVSDQYVGKLMALAWLSPRIVEGVTKGVSEIAFTTEALTSRVDIAASWSGQAAALEVGDYAREP